MIDPIDEALGLTPIDKIIDKNDAIIEIDNRGDIVVSEDKEYDNASIKEHLEDVEKARSNIESMLDQSSKSFKELVSLASQSESPRAFEVMSTMMKVMLDANREFIDTSAKRRYVKEEILKPKEEEKQNQQVINNNLILSTADLLKMIKGGDNI